MPVADFVLESVNSPGTGAFNLAGAVLGRQTFVAGYGSGQVVPYIAHDGTQWEEGFGTLAAGAPDTLTRDRITDTSTPGSTARVNFTGLVQVYSDVPGDRVISASPDNLAVQMGNRMLTEVGQGSQPMHGARLGDVGWRQIGSAANITTTQAAVFFTLPNAFDRFRVEFQNCMPLATAGLYFRASQDGGATYKSGGTDYYLLNSVTMGGRATPLIGADSASFFGMTQNTNGPVFGHLDLDPQTFQATSDAFYASAGSVLGMQQTGAFLSLQSRPTNLVFGFVNTSINRGRLRLLGGIL